MRTSKTGIHEDSAFYTVPGFVHVGLSTERIEFMRSRVDDLKAGSLVLTPEEQSGILRSLADVAEELYHERARRIAIQQKLTQIDGAVTGLWGQLEVVGELARKDVTATPDRGPGRATPEPTPKQTIDEVMGDDG